MEGHTNGFGANIDLKGLEKFVSDGNEVVEFKLVRDLMDLEDRKSSFKPEMCHQIFNETESIFGYEGLQIKIYYTAAHLTPYVEIKYKKRVPPSAGIEPDNIEEKLQKVLPETHISNLDTFCSILEKEKTFRPLGELVHSFKSPVNFDIPNASSKMNGSHGDKSTYEIYFCDASVPKYVEYHKKFEPFIFWFIDAASLIEVEDDKWKFFVIYEKFKTCEGETRYSFVGFTSIYEFYSYPDGIRPRIAQMLILPPFQRQGLAVELLSTIYNRLRTDQTVKEITVEDPSDDFERLRDYVDARDCMKLPSFSQTNVVSGFTQEMQEEALKKYKMTKRQARRMCEIIRLKHLNINDDQKMKEFRLDVKRRLNIPYHKQQSDIKRMTSRKPNAELDQAALIDDATRKTELESNFQLALTHYQYILRRLEKFN